MKKVLTNTLEWMFLKMRSNQKERPQRKEIDNPALVMSILNELDFSLKM